MRRPLTKLLLASLFAVLLMPTQAFAWSNGWEGDGYGTHDWILEEAVDLSGESWVDLDAAMLASDDPDTDEIDDTNDHVFRPDGDGRGAPQRVSDLHYLAILAYQADDMTLASQYLGLLSHYYSDTAVPFHTSDKLESDDSIHLDYELDVDDMTGASGENSDWITPVARQSVPDVRAKTIEMALASRATYSSLRSNYLSSGFNSTVLNLTKQNLSGAVNGLADIIKAISVGEGIVSAGSIEADAPRTNITSDLKVLVSATCTDDAGGPTQGAKVIFTWELPSGTVTDIEFTGPDGVAESWIEVGSVPTNVPFEVIAETTSGADSTSDSVSLQATDVIGTIRTIVPYYPPMQNTLVTASTMCLNTDGEPIPGLQITFTWTHKTTTVVHVATTDEWGIARHARNIGGASIGYVVSVKATTQSGGSNRSSTATFVPKSNNGDSTNGTGVSGDNRFATGAAISKRAYPSGTGTVIVATGYNWPDALGGSALAGVNDASIILATKTSLPTESTNEIARLEATKAIILGGINSVGPQVESALRAAGITSISRISGDNRYETAREIARSTIKKAGVAYDGVAFVTTGVNFPDALAASPLAAFRNWPIYLANPNGDSDLLASEMKSDGVKSVIVIGGSTVVSDAYFTSLRNHVGPVTRLGGVNRYETATEIASYGITSAGLIWDGLAVATGANYPDALAGGVLAARKRSVLLLTNGSSLSPETATTLSANKSDVGTVHFLGGSSAMSMSVRGEIIAATE